MSANHIPKIPKDLLLRYLKNEVLSFGLPDVSAFSTATLLAEARLHMHKSEEASRTGLTDAKTAGRIYKTLMDLETYLIEKKVSEKTWSQFKLVIVYFYQVNDEEHDFDSPVGFDDDAEIVNCFLKSLGNPLPSIPLS